MTGSIYQGIKVLDLTRVVSGPWASQTLADMGATVFKVEDIQGGDMTRRLPPWLESDNGPLAGYSAFYLGTNRGKQSLQIDISKTAGADLVRALAARCDVLIENYKSGGLRKYGLDYGSIRAVKPDIIYCSVTGFGADGPYAHRPAYDFILQGIAGLMSTCGQPDGMPGAMPMRTGVPITDIFTGLYAAIAVQGALYHHARTGEGQFIDIGMLDVSVAVNAHLALGYLMTGQAPVRQGNANPVGSPSDVFECADGFIIIAPGNDLQFAALCEVLGHGNWAADARFVSVADRITHRAPLRALLAACTATRNCEAWLAALEAAGVPCAPINTMREVFNDPQVRHRGLQLTLPHASGTSVPSLRNPMRFSATPVGHRSPPMLGEHTWSALQHELGLTNEQLQALQHLGVVGASAPVVNAGSKPTNRE